MTEMRAINIVKGTEQANSEAEYIAAWQTIINTGYAFKQAWSSSGAIAMLEHGSCIAPRAVMQ